MSGKLRLVLAVCALLAALTPAPTAASAVTAEYFPLPDKRPISEGIVADPDGNVWFGAGMISSETVPPLGKLVPSSASAGTSNGMSFFPTPTVGEGCCANFIRDVAFDPVNSRIWFVRSTGAVGYGVPSLMVAGATMGQSVAKVAGDIDLGGIAIAGDGTAWFTESGATSSPNYYGNRVASAGPGPVISELPSLAHYTTGSFESIRWDADPRGITIAGDGSPWFVESNPGNPGYRLAKVAGGTYQEYLLQPCQPSPPCSGSFTGTGPVSVAAALDGTLWFTNVLKNTFGRFDPGTGSVKQYDLTSADPALTGGQPRWIRRAQDGSLWLAEFGFISFPKANAIVRIVPTDPPTTTVYKLGADNSPVSVAPDTKGNVWFNNSGTSTSSLGRLAGVIDAPATSTKDLPPAGTTTVTTSSSGVAKVGEVLVKGTDIWAKQICVGPPQDRCSLIYLLDSHEYVSGFPGTTPRPASASGKRKTKRVVVGRKSLTLTGGKSANVKISLNAKGKKILKRDGVLKLTFHASQQVTSGKKKTLKPLKTKKLTIRVTK